ncbi:MAG TPA: tRNA (adenosine(37)-N6)-threonylcarbamoyltransferase complex dimerization subunit type 1 TsaB [Candidatus Limnocylindria bacterium]
MIVGIDSASMDLSLAVVSPDGTLLGEDGWSSDRRQGHELLPRLLALVGSTGVGLGELTGIGVGTGPGSFTGLRVGMSIAKGLALALRLPIVGAPSLQAWLASEPDAGAALARAGSRDGYLLVRGEDAPRIVDRDELVSRLDGVTVVAPVELAAAFGLDPGRTRPPLGAAYHVALEAARRVASGQPADDLARLEPSYLRAPRGIGQIRHTEA